MANRSYLYSLSNRPTAYADRPETISGLSEFPYFVPFSYRVLMSGSPTICASLISDGFDDECAEKKTKLHAISSEFDLGFSRLQKFFAVLRPLVSNVEVSRLPKIFSVLRPTIKTSTLLVKQIDETLKFLEAHRNRYLLLETIELDSMTQIGEAELRQCVETEISTCLRAGAAVDALLVNPTDAGKLLRKASKRQLTPPLDAFYGLKLDDDFDSVRDNRTENPLGLECSNVLFFDLSNREQFEANR